jgi:uncharacterized repeat protein (TIGR01451 family)
MKPRSIRRVAIDTVIALLVAMPVLAEDAPLQIPRPQPPAPEPPLAEIGAGRSGLALLPSAPAPLAPVVVAPTWKALGPAPIPNGQTQGRVDPVSGRVTAIAIHPTDPNKVYVGTAQGGVYRSLDGGANWTAIFDGARSLAIGAIAIAPSSTTTVYVGTGEANFSGDSYFGVGVYRIDQAETVAMLNGPFNQDAAANDVFTGASISRIEVDPADANTIFVSTVFGVGGIGGSFPASTPARGIYRSTNAMSASPTFARLSVPTALGSAGDVTDMALDPGDHNNLVCAVRGLSGAGNGGLWRSTNALAATPLFTQTFTIANNTNAKLAADNIGGVVTVLAATGEASGAACPASEGSGGVLRQSTDGGATWPTTLAAANGFCDMQCFYDIAPALDPGNTNNMYLGGAASGTCRHILTESTNGGGTFAPSETGLHADNHAVAVAPSNASIVYTGNDGGIWRSTNAGVDWTSLNNAGFSATQFESLALHPADRNFMIGGTQDNGTEFMRPDGTWTRADFGDGGYALIDQNAADTTNVTMYHTYFQQTGVQIGLARVTTTANASDNNWTFLGASTPPGGSCASNNNINCNDAVLFYPPMALGPGNPNTLYFGTDRLYRSTDRGTTMTVVSQGPFATGCTGGSNNGAACTTNSQCPGGACLGIPVSTIGISPQNDNVRIVGLKNGQVFATTTGANPLTDITGGIPASYVGRAVIDPNASNTAYVALAGFGLAAGQHVWKTTNLSGGGATWVASGTGIPDVPVNALVVDPSDSQMVYAGTDIGVFRSADGGASWKLFWNGPPRLAVFDIAIQNPNRILRAATHGRGVYELDLANLADLAISKTASSATVARGADLTYTIVVTNDGPGTAKDVKAIDTLPPALLFNSSTDTCVEAPVGTLTCSLGDIPAHATRTFTISVTADPNLVRDTCERVFVVNTADAQSPTPDPDASNNESSVTTEIIFPLNHFQCYEIDHQRFVRTGIALDSTFGSGVVDVDRLKRFCNPADKNEEDKLAPMDPCHLAGYEIAREAPPRFLGARNQVIANQFGTITVDITRPQLLLLPTAKDLAAPPAPLVAPPLDHFECYYVRSGRTHLNGLAILDQFSSWVDDVKRPIRLCVPVSKNGGAIIDPAHVLMCYKVKVPTDSRHPVFRGQFFISNQFQDIGLDVSRTTELCVPSVLNP